MVQAEPPDRELHERLRTQALVRQDRKALSGKMLRVVRQQQAGRSGVPRRLRAPPALLSATERCCGGVYSRLLPDGLFLVRAVCPATSVARRHQSRMSSSSSRRRSGARQ